MNSEVRSITGSINSNELLGISVARITLENEKAPSYVAFQKIKDLSSDTLLWEKLLLNVDKAIIHSAEPAKSLHTSCAINSYMLSLLFIGVEKTKKVWELLHFTTSETALVVTGSKIEKLYFYHFLSGNEVINQNKKFQDPSYIYSRTKVLESLKTSKEYITPLKLFNESLQKLFSNQLDYSIYNYNHNVINALEAEIHENSNLVSVDCSFIYHVAITEPNPSDTYKGSFEKTTKSPIGYFHGFVLEHYYSPEENLDFLRLHQSYKDKLSLAEHYTKAGYGDQDQGSMNSTNLKVYFENLRGMLSYDGNSGFPNLRKCQLKCFNVDAKIDPPGVFRMDIGVFTGRSIRYVTSKINPQDCIHNIELIKEQYK